MDKQYVQYNDNLLDPIEVPNPMDQESLAKADTSTQPSLSPPVKDADDENHCMPAEEFVHEAVL